MTLDLLDERAGGGDMARIEPGAVQAITRAEIDSQIATAKLYPRTFTKFLKKAKDMIAASPEIAAQCRYYLPARRGSTETVQGPSVRLAEIAAVCWGNLRIVGRIVADDGRFLTGQGAVLDLEENVGYSVEIKRSVVDRNGRRYTDDMVKVTGNAAISIATRNATFKVIPRSYIWLLEEFSIQVAQGDVKSLPERAQRAIEFFISKGATESRIYRSLGVIGFADLTLDHLLILNGFRTSLTDKQATVDELFPIPEAAEKPFKGTAALTKKIAAQKAEPSVSVNDSVARPLSYEEPPPDQEVDYESGDGPLFDKADRVTKITV